MKTKQPVRQFAVLLGAALLLSAPLHAQTVFTANGVAGSVAGASTNVAATSFDPMYNNFGPTNGNITGVTFGNGFSMTGTSPGSYDNTFIIGGTITGSSLSAGSTIGIGWDFSLAKNAFVTSNATWSLKFSDSITNPGGDVSGATLIGSGILSSASDTFAAGGTYTFASGATTGTSFRTFFEVSYTGNIALDPPIIDGTMHTTGFNGEGVTITSAIPEPSTYGAIAGTCLLGFAAWRRRKAESSLPA